jgi:hypothetical protein
VITAVLVVFGIVLAGLATLGVLVVIDWIEQVDQDRRRFQIVTERQAVERHLDRLTSDAVRQMLDAARQALEGR